MSDFNEHLQLAAEMAAISAVKSEEIVSLARDTGELENFQNRLSDSRDRVAMVKDVLSATPAYSLTPEVAVAMDNQLNRSSVDIPVEPGLDAVQGAECFGRTLLPKVYLETRLAGCESFLGDFFKKSKEISTQVGVMFKEAFILFTQNQDSLEQSLDNLERYLETQGKFAASGETILLGSRLFNRFKVNGALTQDWSGDLSKVSRTISGLSNNYYLNSKNMLNATMGFFGGFADVDDVTATERFLLLPKAIPSERFKECTYPNKDFTTNRVTAKQSVELMGAAFFLDRRQTNPNKTPSSADAVMDYVELFNELDNTSFEDSSEVVFPRRGNEVKALSSTQIQVVIKHLRDTLKEWRKAFDNADRYKLSEQDYSDVTKGIYESQMTDEQKDMVLSAFSSIVRKNQFELLGIRASVTGYLTLIINGMIELCNDSIKVNVIDVD